MLSMSVAAPFVRIAMEAGPFAMAFWRLLFASLLVVPIGRPWTAFANKKAALWALLSGLFLAIHFAVWIGSFSFISVPASVVLVTTTPIFVALLEFAIWKKVPTAFTILGIFVAIGGAFYIAVSGGIGGASFAGGILSLLGAVFGSLYLITSKLAQERLSLWQTVSVSYPVASLLLFLGAFATGGPLWGYNGSTWLAIALMALLPQFIGHTSLNMGMKYLTPILTVTANLFEPVGASIIAWMFLGEAVTASVFIGGGMILAGVLLISFKGRSQ